jgi:hypothetical protein
MTSYECASNRHIKCRGTRVADIEGTRVPCECECHDDTRAKASATDLRFDELQALVAKYVDDYKANMPRQFDGGSAAIYARQAVRREYNAIVTYVRSLGSVERRYHESSIESLVEGVIKAILGNTELLECELRWLLATLDHDLTTKLYVPISGVVLDAPSYSIGALSLIRMDDPAYEQYVASRDKEILRENELYDDTERAGFAEALHRTAPLKDSVCAEVSTDLDIPKTFAYALSDAIESLCDFLQLAASYSTPPEKNRIIAWATDKPEAQRHAYIVTDGPAKNSIGHSESTSPGFPFLVNERGIDFLAELGLNRVANLVGQKAVTQYDDMLKRAVRWFAKAERERHPDDCTLSYVTAIDLFFSRLKPGSATRRVCKGFAFAVAESDAQVAWLARYMRYAYASRSDTSHEGCLGLMDGDSLKLLRWYVQKFISAMARQPFETKSDVCKWVAKREENLSDDVREALDYAVDWKSDKAEEQLDLVASELEGLIAANAFGDATVSLASLVSSRMRDRLATGDSHLRDLKHIALKWQESLKSCEAVAPEKRDRTWAEEYLRIVARSLDWGDGSHIIP